MASVSNNGLIRYLGLFNEERLLVCSPKALSEVLTIKSYDFIKPRQVRVGIGRILGIGVLLAEGEEHKMQRKNLMPAFQYRHIKDLYPIFWNKSKESVEVMTAEFKANAGKQQDLEKEIVNSAVAEDQAHTEVNEWASRATLDIIGAAGLGQEFGAIRDPTTPLFETYNRIFKPNRQAQILGLLGIFLPTVIVRALPIKRNGEIEAASASIRQLCRKLIRAKKEKLEKKELTDVDILSVALESGGFTEENLVDQLMTFLAAGHETTASAMTWTIYMLCLNPDIQTRLRKEVRAHLPSPSSDKPVTSADIDNFAYLNAVCNELLRDYPPVPMTLREAACDTSIVGQFVPKGTKVFIVPWAVNHLKELWGEDADKFNPERWMPSREGEEEKKNVGNGGAASNYANLTFLHGPRSCIGQAFSKAEFACLLASWVGRFEFELRDERELDEKNMVIKGGVTARPAKGMHVKVRVIDGW
jgi:cytochrome P450